MSGKSGWEFSSIHTHIKVESPIKAGVQVILSGRISILRPPSREAAPSNAAIETWPVEGQPHARDQAPLVRMEGARHPLFCLVFAASVGSVCRGILTSSAVAA